MVRKDKSVSKLKKELDKWFSLYIRLRHAIDCVSECYTCNKKDHYKRMDAGHFQSRKFLATRWCEENVQVQCKRCNIFNAGEQYAFSKLLDLRIGDGTAEKLERLARTTVKIMRHEYIEKIEHYKDKAKKLKTKCE